VPRIGATDGTDIAYEAWGPSDGEPLLLVMGLGADTRAWVFQRLAFGRRYRCIAFDNRGAGHSGSPPGPYSLEQMARDAVSVLDAEGIDEAHVLGASMGGVIAQILAVRHADRVRSLVLSCTACRHHDWRRDLLAEWERVAREDGTAHLGPAALRWLIGPRIQRRFGVWLNLLAPIVMSQPGDGFANQARAILDMPDEMRDELPAVRVPTLVVVGSQDTLTPVGDSEELAERIPGARLHVIGGAAHGVMAEAPGAFNEVVLDFLGGVTAPALPLAPSEATG
jgi:3-oxoadipate enol-lactonase